MTSDKQTVRLVLMTAALVGTIVLGSSFAVSRAQMGSGSGGMGGGNNQTNMGNGMGGVMLISGGVPYHADGSRVTMDDAIAIATRYLAALSIRSLQLDEVEEWEFNYYVVVKESLPSQYKAFQLLIDKWTGAVMPEPGPNMMWNLKYGRMMNSISSGMPGVMKKRDQSIGDPNMSVTPQAALQDATQFVQQRFARALAVMQPGDTYYGYYNFDVADGVTGQKYGMLSVNGGTGQVWYHTWHGNYIQGRELN